jgi:membrane protease YdiL (CAAX protease family)
MRAPAKPKHPIRTTLLLELIIIAVYIAAGAAATLLDLGVLTLYYYANVLLVIFAVILLYSGQNRQTVGMTLPRSLRTWAIFGVAFIPALVNLITGGIHLASFNEALNFFLLALMVGFAEEVFFRGLMLRSMLAKGRWAAVIVTAVLFGLTHALNMFAGANTTYTLLQIGYALAIGFCFAAMALHTGTIIPLILAHFLTDLLGFWAGGLGTAEPTTIDFAISIAYVLLFTAYGIWLMKRKPVLAEASA